MMRLRRMCVCFALCCLACIVLVSCSDGEKRYTYASVSEDVKKEVDFILSKESIWDSEMELNIDFPKTSGKKKFQTTNYHYSYLRDGAWKMLKTEYEYDVENKSFQKISEKKIDYVQVEGYGLGEGTVQKFNGWESGWSVDVKKDYLAQKIMERKNRT